MTYAWFSESKWDHFYKISFTFTEMTVFLENCLLHKVQRPLFSFSGFYVVLFGTIYCSLSSTKTKVNLISTYYEFWSLLISQKYWTSMKYGIPWAGNARAHKSFFLFLPLRNLRWFIFSPTFIHIVLFWIFPLIFVYRFIRFRRSIIDCCKYIHTCIKKQRNQEIYGFKFYQHITFLRSSFTHITFKGCGV